MRTTMAELVQQLRGMVNSGTADWAVGTANFWDDDQLQQILDGQRVDHYHEPLEAMESYLGGTLVWLDYLTWAEHLESSLGGTAVFTVEDGAGSAIGTALYTADYRRGVVSFGSSTGGSARWWSGRSYNLNRAAAEVWQVKASHYATQVNFATDNHRVDRGAVYQQCLKMAEFYEQRASGGGQTVTLYRSDAP